MAVLFTHARTATRIDDPGGFLEDGLSSGRFDVPCPEGPDTSAVTVALGATGPLPMAGVYALGLSVPQLVLSGVTALLTVAGLVLLLLGVPVATLVFLVFAVVLGTLTVMSARRRRAGLRALSLAWERGWVRFAPARVGAAGVDRVVRHGPQAGPKEDRGRNQDVRYWYRADVRVYLTDGSDSFTVTTAPFQALPDRDGTALNLRTAPGPVDAAEPEYANGWTVVRYLVGAPEASATVTTNLTDAQLTAALEAAGVR